MNTGYYPIDGMVPSLFGQIFSINSCDISRCSEKSKVWAKHAESSFKDLQVLLLNKLLNGFEGKLYSSKWAKIAKCSQDTALRDIQKLIDQKILINEPSGDEAQVMF